MRLYLISLCLLFGNLYAQVPTQTIRGSLIDKDTRGPMIGTNVALYRDSILIQGTAADLDGRYRLEKVEVGRYTLAASFLGYEDIIIPNLILSSGKELVLDLQMVEKVQKLEATVTASKRKGESLNKLATVSSRIFSVEETERYAGSRGDPARMAANFAGCQGADDSRNDLVIRGNSPLGVLWRVEGVNIPNPSHFAIAGSQGGPVSVLNNKVMSNSDFFTGAFPAEFGNSTAGVFDIRMRKGNNEKAEYTGQFGFLGTELTAEGPISRTKRSSYLLNYRYATISLFSAMGLNIGTNAAPKYQDASFKLYFPTQKGAVSFFGLGGISDIDIVISDQLPEEREIYGEQDRDQFFGTAMGVVGMNWYRRFGDKTYGRLTLAHSLEDQHTHHEYIYYSTDSNGVNFKDEEGLFLVDSLVDMLDYTYRTRKTSAAYSVNHKFNARHVLKIGLMADYYGFDYIDSVYDFAGTKTWTTRWDYTGNAVLLQPYAHWQWKLGPKLTLNTGLHSQYFSQSESWSVLEPRVGLRWELPKNQWLSLGYGLHSQVQPLYTYFYQIPSPNGGFIRENESMGFTKSNHYVLGYERFLPDVRLKVEAYYQQLFDIPVTAVPSSFSLVNQGSGYVRFFPPQLINSGTGENYGLEVTLEKFFANKHYGMMTVSAYNSKYKGSDGVTRDTDFNGNVAVNLLAGREFKTGDKTVFGVGVKFTIAGNKRYGPIDTTATLAQQEIVFEDATRNSLQFDPYMRLDLKLNFRINAKRVGHEIGLDLMNLTGTQNILKLSYAPDLDDPSLSAIREEYQLGFLPIFYYRIDF